MPDIGRRGAQQYLEIAGVYTPCVRLVAPVSQIPVSDLELHDLRRSGRQLRFAEALELLHGTYHRRVLLRNVELDDFGAGQRARVGEPYRDFDFLAVGDGML